MACNDNTLLDLMSRTGYNIVQENGQRKFGPPPGWRGPIPARGCEVFVGKIPRNLFEDELVPLLETVGQLFMLRLMMEFSGQNRGYAFATYMTRAQAMAAIKTLNNMEIRPGHPIGVCISLDNCRLYIGGLPKDKSHDDVLNMMSSATDGIVDVKMSICPSDKTRNRGYAFIEYETHRAAAMARRKLIPGTFQLWGKTIKVDWANPERDIMGMVLEEGEMSASKGSELGVRKSRVLLLRHLPTEITDEAVRSVVELAVAPDLLKMVRTRSGEMAQLHFRSRGDAAAALQKLHNEVALLGPQVEVSYATLDRDKNPQNGQHGTGAGRASSGSGPAANPDRASSSSDYHQAGLPSPGLFADWRECTQLWQIPHNLEPMPISHETLPDSVMLSWETRLQILCRRNGLGPPTFELHVCSLPGMPTGLIYKLSVVPGGDNFFPDLLSSSVEGAREVASWHVYNILCKNILRGMSPTPSITPPPSGSCQDLSPFPISFSTSPIPFSTSPSPLSMYLENNYPYS